MIRNLQIRTRLNLGSGSMLALLFLMGFSAFFAIKHVADEVNILVLDKWPKTVVIDEIRTEVFLEMIALNTLLLTDDPAIRQGEFARITAKREHITALLERLHTRVRSTQGQGHLKNIKAMRTVYLEQLQIALELVRTGDKAETAKLVSEALGRAKDAYLAAITGMALYENSQVDQHGLEASTTVQRTLQLLPVLLLGAAALLAFLTRSITNSITRPVAACVTAANRVAAGDFTAVLDLSARDEIGDLQRAMAQMVEAIREVNSDIRILSQAAIAGHLATRADPHRHQGEFRLVVVGINETLDAVIGPLNVAAEYVERIAHGTIPPVITDPYSGDFLEIKNNLNTCITIMSNLLNETLRVMQAAVFDNLDERANAELFSGDWKKLVTKVNIIITTVVSPLKRATEQLRVEIAARSKAQDLLEELNRGLEARVAAEVARNRDKDRVLMQNEKMATLGQLAAGVAHEINNPMGYISSNLRILLDYFEKISRFDRLWQEKLLAGSSDSVREAVAADRKELGVELILEDGVDLISESLDGAERVKKIVQDLKSFSRMDAAERQFVAVETTLERALSIVNNELKYVAHVRTEYSPAPEVLCHPGQLNQVFVNLLVNAGQAVTESGEIVVKCWHDDAFVYASVSDNGSGIPEELREQIFDPFFTTKEEGKGTGLGLSISNEIINNHQGKLTVESAVGKGTTFTVSLPL